MRSDKAVNTSQADKERAFHVHILVEVYASDVKIHSTIVLQPRDCL